MHVSSVKRIALFAVASITANLCTLATVQAAAQADSVVFSQGSYRVTKRTDTNGEWVYQLADNSVGSYIEVHQKGGIIRKYVVSVNGVHYSVYKEGSGNPKMMPWPNRTAHGTFTDAQSTVQNLFATDAQGVMMTLNDGSGNAMHGMVMARLWSVEQTGSDSEGVYIKCYFDNGGSPVISNIFGAFRDYSVYHLKANRLIIDAYVQNKANAIFGNAGWGWHPWVNVPLIPIDGTQNGARAKCSLLLPASSIALVDNVKIPTGVKENVGTYNSGYYDFRQPRSIGTVSVDNYFTDLIAQAGYTRALFIDYGNKVRVQYLGQYPFYPWMVLYTSSGGDFVCVEHQTEEVNGLNTKQNLISIAPNSTSAKGRIIMLVDNDTTALVPTQIARSPAVCESGAKLAVSQNGTVSYRLAADSPVRLSVFTPAGVLVQDLVRERQAAGSYTVAWNRRTNTATTSPAGAYVVVLQTAQQRLARMLSLCVLR